VVVFSKENRTNVINYNEKSLLELSSYLNGVLEQTSQDKGV